MFVFFGPGGRGRGVFLEGFSWGFFEEGWRREERQIEAFVVEKQLKTRNKNIGIRNVKLVILSFFYFKTF